VTCSEQLTLTGNVTSFRPVSGSVMATVMSVLSARVTSLLSTGPLHVASSVTGVDFMRMSAATKQNGLDFVRLPAATKQKSAKH